MLETTDSNKNYLCVNLLVKVFLLGKPFLLFVMPSPLFGQLYPLFSLWSVSPVLLPPSFLPSLTTFLSAHNLSLCSFLFQISLYLIWNEYQILMFVMMTLVFKEIAYFELTTDIWLANNTTNTTLEATINTGNRQKALEQHYYKFLHCSFWYQTHGMYHITNVYLCQNIFKLTVKWITFFFSYGSDIRWHLFRRDFTNTCFIFLTHGKTCYIVVTITDESDRRKQLDVQIGFLRGGGRRHK